MKKECEIVRDLLPNYVENLVGTQTKDFIKDHLKTCSECTKILKNMEGKDDINYDNDIKEEEVEIRQIKKFRKKQLILTLSSIGFIIIILSIVFLYIFIYLPKKSIITETYSKIQEITNFNNYKFTTYQYYITADTQKKYEFTDTFYYKNGKYKNESTSENSDIIKTTYGETTSDSSTFIYHDNNTNSITTTSNLYSAKGKVFGVFSDIYYISNDFSRILGLNIRNDTYNNAECYVLKFNNSSTDYRELWINKETKLPVRELQHNSNGFYFERTFKLEPDSVTDTDILLNK